MSHWLLFAFDGAGRSNLIMCPPVLNLLPHRPLETPTTSRHVVNSPRRIRVARRPSVLIQALYETFKTLKHFSWKTCRISKCQPCISRAVTLCAYQASPEWGPGPPGWETPLWGVVFCYAACNMWGGWSHAIITCELIALVVRVTAIQYFETLGKHESQAVSEIYIKGFPFKSHFFGCQIRKCFDRNKIDIIYSMFGTLM